MNQCTSGRLWFNERLPIRLAGEVADPISRKSAGEVLVPIVALCVKRLVKSWGRRS